MSEYQHTRAYLDPLGLVLRSDSSRAREIELVLSDAPARETPSLTNPVLRLDAARALAHELLALAEQAEHPQLLRPAR